MQFKPSHNPQTVRSNRSELRRASVLVWASALPNWFMLCEAKTTGLGYEKVILATDADVDGRHKRAVPVEE